MDINVIESSRLGSEAQLRFCFPIIGPYFEYHPVDDLIQQVALIGNGKKCWSFSIHLVMGRVEK